MQHGSSLNLYFLICVMELSTVNKLQEKHISKQTKNPTKNPKQTKRPNVELILLFNSTGLKLLLKSLRLSCAVFTKEYRYY